MKRTFRTELTVETAELLVIEVNRGNAQLRCAECGNWMVTLEQAIALAGVSSRTIHRGAEARKFHFVETSGGLLMICVGSLCSSTSSIVLEKERL